MKAQPEGGTIKNGLAGEDRQSFESATSSGGANPTNVSAEDNASVMMNTPGLKPRAFRADQLIEMAGDDMGRLGIEAPRTDKMKG